MAYCTQAQIQNAVGGVEALTYISDTTNTATNTSAVTSAIEAATSRVDMYAIGTAGTTGTAGALWTSTPTQATQVSIDIAVYTLYERIWRTVPDSVKTNYDNAIKQLELLQAGKVSWVVGEDPPAINAGRVYYFGPGSTNRTDAPRRTTRTSLDTL